MPINITPIYHDGLDCLEGLLISVAAWWKCEYELIFSKSWGFGYKEGGNLIGPKIFIPGEGTIKLLEHFCGIRAFYHDLKNNPSECLNIIKKELEEGRPTIIYMNSFWCPWTLDYKKKKAHHFCLVAGINEDGSLNGIDTAPINSNINLPLDHFMEGSGCCITVSKMDNYFKPANWREILINSIMNFEGAKFTSNSCERINKFAYDIQNSLDLNTEVRKYQDDFTQCDLIMNLHKVSRSRFHFAILLSHFAAKFGIARLTEFSKEFEYIGTKWFEIKSLILKAALKPDSEMNMSRVVNKISEVSYCEKEVSRNMLNFCKYEYGEHSDSDKKRESIVSNEIDFIDLNRYLNNRGFSQYISQNYQASFTEGGDFLVQDEYAINQAWKVNKMEFGFPDIADNVNDNISCTGENIRIPNNYYSSVMILGCAEWSSLVEKIKIYYESGAVESITVEFTDWVSNPRYSEEIAWTGNAMYRSGDGVHLYNRKMNLFAKEYPLNRGDVIKSIQLPDCPNIHIFAVSLRKNPDLIGTTS